MHVEGGKEILPVSVCVCVRVVCTQVHVRLCLCALFKCDHLSFVKK